MKKKQIIKSTGFQNDLPMFDLLKLAELDWLKDILGPESIYLSCDIIKINGYGVKNPRILFITEESLYNWHTKKAASSKKIIIDRIDALTIGTSDEFIVHMKNGYDHRYKAGRLRDTIVGLLMRLRRRIQTREIEANKDNIYVTLDQEFSLYKVNRANLKIYTTLKTEAPKAIFRRPPKEFLVDDFGFEIGFKNPYNG